MSEDERLARRLQQFYDQVPDVEDALPFKDYLIKHEDSRMAWYLLGKQYAAKGETSKANYCFYQAGDIYEAFESKPAPDVPEAVSNRRTLRRRRRIVLLSISSLLLLVGLAVPGWKAFAPDHEARKDAVTESRPSTAPTWQRLREDASEASPASTASADTHQPDILPGIVAATEAPGEGGSISPDEWLREPNDRTPRLLVRSHRIGLWQDWLKSGDPLASVTSGATPDSSIVSWFNPAWCECMPADPTNVSLQVETWKPVQEEKLAFVSAIRHFRARTNALPETPADLAGSYPNNYIAGWTTAMDGWFQEMIIQQSERVGAFEWPIVADDTSEFLDGRAVPSGDWLDLTIHPLEIIVDKSNHRLAVVSGRVLLRNYAVGLGGELTPEGQFVISEKVRDPNGMPEGVFGSRGMTLSDTRYGIHGTNEPESIGKDESLGCIRMLQEDIEELYDLVPLDTKVTITDGGLPLDIRVPPQRFRLPQAQAQDETNPDKVYDWLG